LQAEFGEKGLVVLALSDETPEKVAEYVDQMGITVRVASGFSNVGAFKIPGYPSATIIGPDGKIAWFGDPRSLSAGTVKEALAGAKPRSSSFLAVVPSKAPSGKLAPIAKSMEQGKIGKAHASLRDIAGSDKSTAEEREDAKAFAAEIEAHVKLLNEQAEAYVASRNVVDALTVLEAVSKEFAGAELGTTAKARVDQIRKDPALSKELQAAESLEKLRSSVAKLASSKARDKYREFAEKHSGTRASDRARALASKAD
jgi:hypothetical protein